MIDLIVSFCSFAFDLLVTPAIDHKNPAQIMQI